MKITAFGRRLAAILGAGVLVRGVYVLVQPRFDPTFAHPILDGAYYTTLAHAIVSGTAPGGVPYMPPLYPEALALFFRLFGEAWGLLSAVQQLLTVAAAGALALVARRAAGEVAGLGTAVVVLLYHPTLFFASKPLGEPLALVLLAVALLLASSVGAREGFAAGAASGFAALARPNFLPMPIVWSFLDAVRGRWRRALALAGGLLLALLPAACRHHAVSGRWVPVSANGGVVFWLGNAPGAVGVYTPAPGFSGSLETQQAEAIAAAERLTGTKLDPLAADAFWWREGLRVRAADLAGTWRLLVRRAALTIDNAEHGLDYAPALDANPVRWMAPLPFAAILGLAVCGLAASGIARSGGLAVWSATAVAAAAPLVFYVSSRHRLPVALLLAVPAGAGFEALLAKRWRAAAAGAVAMAVSFAVPSGDLLRTERAGALSLIADAERHTGRLDEAESRAGEATALDPGNAVAWLNLGVIRAARGNTAGAEEAYRGALRADPTQPDAAANLAALLVAKGRPREASELLERAVAVWPRHSIAWTNLAVAYAAAGDRTRAREAADRAAAAGAVLDPELIRALSEAP